MVQFLSIKFFFFDFFNFCWVFQKFPFFCVTLYNHTLQSVTAALLCFVFSDIIRDYGLVLSHLISPVQLFFRTGSCPLRISQLGAFVNHVTCQIRVAVFETNLLFILCSTGL